MMLIRNRVPKVETIDDAQRLVSAGLGVKADPIELQTPGGRLHVYRPATPEGWHGPAGEVAITAHELRVLQPWWPAETAFKVAKVKSLLRSPIWLAEAGPGNALHSGSYLIMATRRTRVLLWVMDSPEWRPLQIYDRLNVDYGGFVSELIDQKVIRTIPRRVGTGVSSWQKVPLAKLECQMQWKPVRPPKLAPMSPFSPAQEELLRSKGWRPDKVH